jgi:hypothetical protein
MMLEIAPEAWCPRLYAEVVGLHDRLFVQGADPAEISIPGRAIDVIVPGKHVQVRTCGEEAPTFLYGFIVDPSSMSVHAYINGHLGCGSEPYGSGMGRLFWNYA